MKKFGWSEGKGFGVKEDGISDYIKVDYKFGNKGNFGDFCDIIFIVYFVVFVMLSLFINN